MHWKASDAELQCIIDSSTLRGEGGGGRKGGDSNTVHSPVSIPTGRWLPQLCTDKCTDVLSRCFWEGVRLSASNRAVAGEGMISVGETSGSSLSEGSSSVFEERTMGQRNREGFVGTPFDVMSSAGIKNEWKPLRRRSQSYFTAWDEGR